MFTISIQSLAVCKNLSYLNDGDSWLGRVTMLGKWMHYITLSTVSIRWNNTSVFYILLRFYKSTFFERHVHCTDNCNSIHDSMILYNITSSNNFYNGIDKNRNHNAYVNIYNMKTSKNVESTYLFSNQRPWRCEANSDHRKLFHRDHALNSFTRLFCTKNSPRSDVLSYTRTPSTCLRHANKQKHIHTRRNHKRLYL